MRKTDLLVLAVVSCCGCVRLSPEIVDMRPPAAPTPESKTVALQPLVIEVALLPDSEGTPPREVSARRDEYIREIHACYELGASMARLQPLASDSAPENYHFDGSLANYRDLTRDILMHCTDIILDCDLKHADIDAARWIKSNKRIELDSTREEDNPLTVAVGDKPLELMRQVIRSGGNLRLGLHDSHAWPYKGRPTNLDYLRQALSMARETGRPIATPAEAREILKLPPLARVYAIPSAFRVKKGEPFSLDVIVQPLPMELRAYVVMISPLGKRYSLAGKGKMIKGLHPIIKAGEEGIRRPYFKTVISTRIPSAIKPGKYIFYAGLMPPGGKVQCSRALGLAEVGIVVE